ncbi:MAG: glycosyltransferase [Rhodospirillales bacterium]|nr:glycosyltransferase [Rhodospirillales bacterium]
MRPNPDHSPNPAAAQASRTGSPAPRVAVLVPCYNEAVAIGSVVADFRSAIPDATVYVYDNNSSDGTDAAARAAGAVVRRETLQGKGHVVRRMFADIDADLYILVDGDGTYDAATAPMMVERMLLDGLDMVTGTRITHEAAAYRLGHRFGNRLLTGLVQAVFGDRVSDMLSGYRAFSRRFVKSFPALTSGFEIETELTVHALELRMPLDELPTAYSARPPGGSSKLRTVSDGIRILRTILVLVKEERPLQFFSLCGLAFLLLGFGFGIPVVVEYFHTGLVPRLPTAVLSSGLVLLSFVSMSLALILDSVARGRKEMKRLMYLQVPGVQGRRAPG